MYFFPNDGTLGINEGKKGSLMIFFFSSLLQRNSKDSSSICRHFRDLVDTQNYQSSKRKMLGAAQL